jgi:outer membrane biosynthesis protein TonB
MIKNLLFSILLHSLLIAIIYANFNLQNYQESELLKVSVSLVALEGVASNVNKKAVVVAKKDEEKKPKETKKPIRAKNLEDPKSPKKAKKSEVKKLPKKTLKPAPLPKKANKKLDESKNNQFKKPEEESKEIKPEVKEKDEKIKEETKIDEEAKTKEEKNLGVKKESEEEKEVEEKSSESSSQEIDIVNNLDNINLSLREKFNILSQLKRCYKKAIIENAAESKLKIVIKVRIAKDGSIESDIEEMIDLNRYNDKKEVNYKVAIDNVRKTLELCSPLRNLPLDKYEIWKEIVLEFDENMKKE